QQRQLVGGAVDDQRVTCIMSPLKPDHDVGLLGQPVDDFAFPLVPPLGPNPDHIGHEAAFLRAGAVRNYLAATTVCPALSPSRDRAPCQASRRGRDGASRPQPNCLIFRALFHPLPSPRSTQRKICLSPRQSRANFTAPAILVRALSGLRGRGGEARASTY